MKMKVTVMIEFKNVTKRYGEKTAVDDVSVSYTHLTLPTKRIV